MDRLHESIAGTASISLAAASRIKGTVVADATQNTSTGSLRIGNPAGVTIARVQTTAIDEAPHVRFELLGFSRTAWRLMEGTAYYGDLQI